MRNLTFKGYLITQLKELSGISSASLYTFSKLSQNNARLKDVLSLFLALYTKEDLRNRLVRKFDYLKKPSKKLEKLNENNIKTFLNNPDLSEYKTVYDNYLYAKNRKEYENKLKTIMHKRICEVKKEKKISNYKIYKELELNHGNTNAFLKSGNVRKVSLDTARCILEFVNKC